MRHTRVLLLNERIIHSLTSYHFFASNQKNGEVLDTTRIQNGQRTCKTRGGFRQINFPVVRIQKSILLDPTSESVVFCRCLLLRIQGKFPWTLRK